MSGNEMEAHLGVESAKLRLLRCFDRTYPHLLDDKERGEWCLELTMAQNGLQLVQLEITAALAAPVLQRRTS